MATSFGTTQRPIILGIVGDSAAGKTTLSRGIAQVLGLDRVAVLCTDDYHLVSYTHLTLPTLYAV